MNMLGWLRGRRQKKKKKKTYTHTQSFHKRRSYKAKVELDLNWLSLSGSTQGRWGRGALPSRGDANPADQTSKRWRAAAAGDGQQALQNKSLKSDVLSTMRAFSFLFSFLKISLDLLLNLHFTLIWLRTLFKKKKSEFYFDSTTCNIR